MKAIVWTRYGSPDGLVLREVDKPTPKDNQVLVRVRATTVTAGDCGVRKLAFPPWLWVPIRIYMGIFRPRNIILGQEVAGDVEAVGKDVTRFKPGDPVFGSTGPGFGGYAEYIRLPEDSSDAVLITKPANASYEEAAAIPMGGLEALYFLRKGNIQRGEKVLIVGAGGSIGTIGVQLAKYYGAEVTAVDSTGKMDMLREIGSDHVVDYTQEDYTRNGQAYDVIFDVIGKSPFAGSLRSLKPTGRYLLANPSLSQILRSRLIRLFSSKQIVTGPAKQANEDLVFLRELIEAGELKTIIDRRFPLEETAAAHWYAEAGGKKGNIVITVGEA